MDPAAYLRHVGLPAQGWTPTVAALGRLHRAHVDAIPFTSVTTALGRVPALDLPTLERRMVAERRGGYCLEHVTLFAAVLDALGFDPRVRLCRVGDPAEVDADRPPTHLTVLARTDDDPRRWMADVGFGVGVLGPVPVPASQGAGEPVRHGTWEHRADVVENGDILLHRARRRRLAPAAHDVRPRRRRRRRSGTPTAGSPCSRGRRSPAGSSPCARRTTCASASSARAWSAPRPTASRRTTSCTPAAALDALQGHFGVTVDEDDRQALLQVLEAGSVRA